MLTAGMLLAIAARTAEAQVDLACEAPQLSGIGDQAFFAATEDDANGPVVFEAGSIEAIIR